MRRLILCVIGLTASPALAQGIVFDAAPTEVCLRMAEPGNERACIGLAAGICMEATEGGSSTVGMGACLDQERQYWDGRLNAVYKELIAAHKASDAEMNELGSSAPSEEEALRAMQRAWIPFRDAACDYERSWWGMGTGAGPATVACHMQETAAQVLRLERRLRDEVR